jgi:N-acetylglucosaminyldiphosphoundecaprenol N-acetyl-beta-D-mannosaminyltransferase
MINDLAVNTKVFNILGVKINATDIPRATDSILKIIETKQKAYICVAPVATIVDAQKDKEYLKTVNASVMTVPDGMPVVWLGKLQGEKVGRTYGPDLMSELCDKGREFGIKHFLYGGNDQTNELLVTKLKEKYPGIIITGFYAPGILKVKEVESQVVLDKINQAKPDILWVGLGSPKQDYWMSIHRDKLEVPVMVGVGAAFDFISGVKPKAPKWMQRSGLEWLFRLCNEPRRLWRRYLLGNTYFIYLLIKSTFKNIFSKS